MTRRTFRLETALEVGAVEVVDFLMDLERHHGLHPFLVRAEVVAQGRDAEGAWWRWRVTERPPLGRWYYSLTFPARLVRTSPVSMHARVRAAPGCHLESITTAQETPGGVVLRETTVVRSPRPVVGYMTREARVAHERTFERLGAALAAR